MTSNVEIVTDPGIIKVCIDPQCENVYTRIPKKVTRCECGMLLVEINLQTFFKKFAQHFFQINYQTGAYCRVQSKVEEKSMPLPQLGKQLLLDLT